METKQIEIDCPHCSTRILVDVRTSQVLRTMRPGEVDSEGKPVVAEADWDDALGRVKDRTAAGDDKLDQALERERNKASRLDDLFRKANEDLEVDGDED